MKNRSIDYFDGFIRMFEFADSAGRLQRELYNADLNGYSAAIQKILRSACDEKRKIYGALSHEFLPPIERGSIFDMVYSLYSLTVSTSRAGYCLCTAGDKIAQKLETAEHLLTMTEATGKTVRELRNYKRSASLPECADRVHELYTLLLPLYARDVDRLRNNPREYLLMNACDALREACNTCENTAHCVERLISENS